MSTKSETSRLSNVPAERGLIPRAGPVKNIPVYSPVSATSRLNAGSQLVHRRIQMVQRPLSEINALRVDHMHLLSVSEH